MIAPCVPAPITSIAIDSNVHTSRHGGLANRGKTEGRVRRCLVFGPFGSEFRIPENGKGLVLWSVHASPRRQRSAQVLGGDVSSLPGRC